TTDQREYLLKQLGWDWQLSFNEQRSKEFLEGKGHHCPTVSQILSQRLLKGKTDFICCIISGQDASFIFINQSLKWTEALSYCREHHTDLARVRSTTENEEIKALIQAGVKPQAWIGLYRSSWTWVDGSIFSFQHWRTAEPNGSTENCGAAVMEDGGKWEDLPCDWKMPFFCYDGKPGFSCSLGFSRQNYSFSSSAHTL
uniref:C-type lectin domain-containing protein n=1 Tax=Fundulus heteroclitus TaxID=8078 RepID=A0A3Q2R003_FUNHE